jgi:putative two-component system response regulator
VRTHVKLSEMQRCLRKENFDLEELVMAKVREITIAQLAVVSALVKLTETRDNETGKHLERVQRFCQTLTEELYNNSPYMTSINPEYIENIYYAAQLHDIGKVGIPDSILLKPGKYTAAEFEVMKTHVLIGSDTLIEVRKNYLENSYLSMAIEITRYHHEKWNGAGYPDGLKGEAIPLSARILALADVYDALRSHRPYKEAFAHQDSVAIILEDSGKHFDPEIVKAFMRVEATFDRIFQTLSE